MKSRRLGRTSLFLPRLALGTSEWGRAISTSDAEDIVHFYTMEGGHLFDVSEHDHVGIGLGVLGGMIDVQVAREDILIMARGGWRNWRRDVGSMDTMLGHAPRDNPYDPKKLRVTHENSRATLGQELNETLEHLGTDYVDLWIVDGFLPTTSIEEVAHHLTMAVNSGRTRYVGVCNWPTWATVRLSDLLGGGGGGNGLLTGPGLACSMNEYSLLRRYPEQELVDASQALGFGLIGYAPLARGVLTGKYRNSTPPDSRAASQFYASEMSMYLTDESDGVVEALSTAAAGLDRSAAELALAWARDSYGMCTTVVEPRTAAQLNQLLLAENLDLPTQIRHALDEVTAQFIRPFPLPQG